MKITFTNTSNVDDKYAPVPAIKILPEWYKNQNSYKDSRKGLNDESQTNGTIKKCVPVLDAITAGYLLLTPADVLITQKDGAPFYQWAGFDLIHFHSVSQAEEHPNRNNHMAYPKWINYWAIKTPKGYSTMFTAPKHRDNVFTILDGIVDTDIYNAPVNFPFVLNDINFEGLIPAGTPIAQVIPFKRDSFEMKIGNEDDYKKSEKDKARVRSKFFNSYKNQFWNRKEYK
jgi:hypothetical protein